MLSKESVNRPLKEKKYSGTYRATIAGAGRSASARATLSATAATHDDYIKVWSWSCEFKFGSDV
jgi:hypothetical protein